MSVRWSPFVRGLVIVGAALVVLAGVLAFRREDVPLYVAYVLTTLVLFPARVEVLSGMSLRAPALAVTIGFVYIAGLPIVLLCNLPALVFLGMHRVSPERWRAWLPEVAGGSPAFRGRPGSWLEMAPSRETLVDWSSFAVGLGIRWWVAASVMPTDGQFVEAYAITLGELAGYAFWSLLATLPVYSFIRPVLTPDSQQRAVQQDLGLVVALALTPFVFLIVYGFRVHGLEGAVGWSLGSFGLHFLLRRLTERRRTVEAQNRSLEALNRELAHRERLSAIGKMSSVVSHQILHQLGVIGIYADLLRNVESSGDVADTLAQVRTNAEAIEGALADVNRVLRDLLVFSGDLRLNLYEHSVASIIAESVDGCRAEAVDRRVAVRIECPPNVNVVLDKLKMTQAVANILRNAIQVSPPGSAIVVRGSAAPDSVELAIVDAGPGIAEEWRAKIFAPFFTTKDGGVGLGLAIAREFAEAHGGSVRLEASTASGATFVVRLPRRGPRRGADH